MNTKVNRRLIRELPVSQQPANRLEQGKELSITELIAVVLNAPDALDLAQEIVSRFTLSDLIHVTSEELQDVYGIGPARANQLLAAFQLGQKLIAHTENYPTIKSPQDASNVLMPQMRHLQEEHMIVLLLDTKNQVKKTIWLYKGTLNSSVVRVSEFYREAIRHKAAAIIIAHNHPSGNPWPSPEDIRITRDVREAGEIMDIKLLDHIIIGNDKYISMKERHLGF